MPEGVEIRKSPNTLDLFIDGEPLAVYNFASAPMGNWHPYFHPVFGPNGLPITQNGEFPGTLRGHYWHQGVFIAHQKFRCGGTTGNTWEETLGLHGRIRHVDFPRVDSRPQEGRFSEMLEWLDATGNQVLARETRTVTVPRRPPERRAIDFDITLTPGDPGPLVLEATPYHLLAVRVPNSMVVLEQKRDYVRRYGRLVDFGPLERGGQVTNSEGQKDQFGQGAHARWMDFSGPLGETVSGIAIFNHPGNFRSPTAFTNWKNMTISAAPTYHEPHTVPRGESLRLRYRVFIHAGDVEEGRVADEYRAYEQEARR